MNVATIVQNHYCLGCGLCVSDTGPDKLRMTEQEDGFMVPTPQDGFDCNVDSLREYCPGVTVRLERPLKTRVEKTYGPLLDLKVAYANDEKIRHRGSSGGCLTAILCSLLEQGKIVGVLQAGASQTQPTRTVYKLSKTVDEIVANAGSRYAPSSLLVDFRNILDTCFPIAVVGKPCDIVAVRQFLTHNQEHRERVYCTLSFMCMGMPSQHATTRMIRGLGIQDESEVTELKYRGDGWPGQVVARTATGGSRTCSYQDSWGRILGRDVHFRCKICPDGWGYFADISAGDAWHTDGRGPLFDESPGRSLIFVRSERGREVIEAVARSITFGEYDICELPIIQKSQHARTNRVWSSYSVLKLRGDRLLRFSGVGMWTRVFKSSPLDTIRGGIGLMRRIPR